MSAADLITEITADVAVILTEKHFEDGIEIKPTVIGKGKISRNKRFDSCKFSGGIWIKEIEVVDNLIFDNCTFEGVNLHTFFERIHGKWMTFRNCQFETETTFWSMKNQRIWIHACTFNNSFTVHAGVTQDFRIAGLKDVQSKFRDIRINSSLYKSFSIRNSTVTSHLSFNKNQIKSVFIGSGQYEKIAFNNCKNFERLKIAGDDRIVDNLQIRDFYMPYIELTGNVLVQNASIDQFNISPFIDEEGRLKFQNINFRGDTYFRDSDLSNVQFNEIDFTGARVTFDNTYLGDTEFSNIKWPHNNEMYHSYEMEGTLLTKEEKRKAYSSLQEVYRQLKHACREQSNFIDALKFYRNEMDYFWKITKGEKKSLIRKIEDYVTIGASRLFSDFGQSLWRPFAFLLIIHWILFAILNYQGGYGFSFSFLNADIDHLKKAFDVYFTTLNPLHGFEYDEVRINGVIDFFMRLFGSYFIYHIIRASRKYTKI